MKTGLAIPWYLMALTAAALAGAPRPPNVIVIVADQLRYQSTGYGGDPRAVTPNLDSLAVQGMNFRQSVANTPVCSAWRASFLTGKYASSTGVAVNELRMNPNQDSIAHMFARGGYACDLIGKWHLWAANSNHNAIQNAYTPPGPYRMGFDKFWAGYNFNHENYQAWYFRDTPEPHRIEGFGDAKFLDLAMERVREHAKQQKPFFMMLALSVPHDPWSKNNVPAAWYQRFKDVDFPLPATWSDQPDPYMDRNAEPAKWIDYWKPRMNEFQRVYHAMTAALDEQVGRLLAAIDDAGVRDNTIVVFTSDHGEMFGAHGRVFKMTFYEEAARTPLLIRWPGHIPVARSDACISTVDLMPTLLGLAGREIPKGVEGMDLSRLVLGKGGPEPAAALLQGMGHTYLWEDGFEWRALRDSRFTYARYLRDGRELLFANDDDPAQQHDLAQDETRQNDLRRLRNQMNQRLGAIGDTFEKCSWYRDQFTINRVIVRGARGEFHREFGADVPVDTSLTKPGTNDPTGATAPAAAAMQVVGLPRQQRIQWWPDLLWFDEIDMKTDAQVEELYQSIRKLRPECIINSRIQGCRFPEEIPPPHCDYITSGDNEILEGLSRWFTIGQGGGRSGDQEHRVSRWHPVHSEREFK